MVERDVICPRLDTVGQSRKRDITGVNILNEKAGHLAMTDLETGT